VSKLSPKSPLDGFSQKWDGLTLEEKHIGEAVSFAAALDQEKAFDTGFEKTFGTSLPLPLQAKQIEGGWAAWLGVNQYMLLLNGENSRADEELAAQFGDCAYATLQTDGWALLDFTGDRAIDALERFIPLDLRRAPKNFAARIITAGGSGMGAGAAKKLAENGYKIAVLSSSGKGEALAKELGGITRSV